MVVIPWSLSSVSRYYERRGQLLSTWDDLLTDPQMLLAFPDLAAMDMAGEFLCSFVEIKGLDESERYLRALQSHVASYSKSMSVTSAALPAGKPISA